MPATHKLGKLDHATFTQQHDKSLLSDRLTDLTTAKAVIFENAKTQNRSLASVAQDLIDALEVLDTHYRPERVDARR